ncbi:DUF2460 domain-containing protein [Novosphingobium mangrovi (ex Huang et al. 2023)]|uniref:DUF2460 domain-containing protein n=1 Tax=Novosphingobium mangrovi (ex Huang et al. 2023) TaxID=2976432 RepID=A0ABT2I324_9SPHN|nr:DUF2460 domain-containing protein [Novosphingobium mangrovi (ex Huang et al. 2023)]MCT2399198.1 DUF2460 domain-containing protein [Novosphingobium mangrovi (ex Huang et al. 2023)]
MAFWLASKRQGQASDWITRFDPRFWTVNFPRPMVATVVSTGPASLRVDASFLRKGDLGGLIWSSEDRLDHPLLAYRTDRNYARTSFRFRWRSGGVLPLDAVYGPTLTIEGRDEHGAARTWYVRLWNYAQGTGEDAALTLNFSDLQAGFSLPGEAIWPGDIDRMFISFAPPGYDGSGDPLPAEVEGWIEMSGIATDGARAMLEIGDLLVPPHGLALATGYDDEGVQTPARLLRNTRQLGYRGSVVHYVGMSHYFRLTADSGAYLAGQGADPLNTPTRAWHRAFFAECVAMGFSPVASLSYELLDQHCPENWKQRDGLGHPALTGWAPPSTLLSPASAQAMTWLQSVATAFAELMADAGAPVRFQVGEPWWWTFPDGRICLYDEAATLAFGGAPPAIPDMRAPLDTAQTDLLDAAGAVLAQSTADLVDAVRAAAAPEPVEALALVFTPTLLAADMPELKRANLPTGWASPAFDRLQVEDYDWLTAGADGLRRKAYAEVNERLGYPPEEQDYLAGFVLDPVNSDEWRRIDAGIDEALARAPHEVVVWALPQIARDGYVRLPSHANAGIDAMQAFDDIAYPLALGRDATVIPEFSTSVAVTASGFERRNSLWSNARLRFDVGPGVRSEAELGTLIAFYRARRGPARGFRLRDPLDHSSNGMTGGPTPLDQVLGSGDGLRTEFALVKTYGEDNAAQIRRITRPDVATLLVSIDGAMQAGNWAPGDLGTIAFDTPPAAGAVVRAGFLFDVPVRFAEDQLEVSGAAFAAGEAPSVPVVEIREAS